MVISMKKNKLLLVIAIACSVVAIAITIGFLIYNPSDSSTATTPLGGKVEQLPERSDTFSADANVAGEDSSIENGTTSLTEKNRIQLFLKVTAMKHMKHPIFPGL